MFSSKGKLVIVIGLWPQNVFPANVLFQYMKKMFRSAMTHLRCIERVLVVEFKIELELLAFIQCAFSPKQFNGPAAREYKSMINRDKHMSAMIVR